MGKGSAKDKKVQKQKKTKKKEKETYGNKLCQQSNTLQRQKITKKEQKKENSSDRRSASKELSQQSGRKGRPKKQKIQQPPIQQKQYWYQNHQATEIVKVLCGHGSIIFKIKGGQSAASKKSQLQSANIENIDFDEYKKERQAIYRLLKQEQKNLIQLMNINKQEDEQEDQLLFFIGENKFETDQEDELLKMLQNVIHPDFMKTFQQILSHGYSELFYDRKEHKHLVDWALMKSWSQKGIQLFEQLSNPYVGDNFQKEYQDEQNKLNECKKFYQVNSANKLGSGEEQKLGNLMKTLDKEYKKHIDNLIQSLISI